jgi:hypothetical protein
MGKIHPVLLVDECRAVKGDAAVSTTLFQYRCAGGFQTVATKGQRVS